MYKTIRHGENSLQYTILPQNDDFRLEGKIKGGGGCKKSKAKKPRRRSFFAYLGLLFVCTVIVGAVLVPFLVSAECLPNPTEWFLKTKAAFSKSVADKPTATAHAGNALGNAMLNKGSVALLSHASVGKPVKIINKDGVEKILLKVNKTSNAGEMKPSKSNDTLKHRDPIAPMGTTESQELAPQVSIGISPESNDLGSIEKDLTHISREPAQPAISIKADDPNAFSHNPTDAVVNQVVATQSIVVAATTTTASPATSASPLPLLTRLVSSAAVPNVPRASLQSSLNQQQQQPQQQQQQQQPPAAATNNGSGSLSTLPTITTRIMQVPLLKSTAKKPAIPPVLVRNLSPMQAATNDNNNNNIHNNLNDIIPSKTTTGLKEVSKAPGNSDWIHSHWPYIDPSTYFQWNGYKTEDSVLLPALLGFALIGVILIITVCLVARNKRTIVTSVRKRNRNDIEESSAEDNTTLLTSTNLSDED